MTKKKWAGLTRLALALLVCLMVASGVSLAALAAEGGQDGQGEDEISTSNSNSTREGEQDALDTPPVPQAAAPEFWAVGNLVAAIASVVLSLIMLVETATTNRREVKSRDGAIRERAKAGFGWRLCAIGLGIIAPFVFLATQNMNNPMAWVDSWTLLMATLFVGQVFFLLLMRKARFTVEALTEGEAE